MEPREIIALGRICYGEYFQRQLARDLGTYASTVTDWVNGEQTCRSISALALILLVANNLGVRVFRVIDASGATWSYSYSHGGRGKYSSPGEAALSAIVNAARQTPAEVQMVATTCDLELLRLAIPEGIKYRVGHGH